MAGQSAPDWPADLLWRESWDHHAHGFRAFGEVNSTGLCTHVARTSSLPEEEAPDSVPKCLACLMVHGQELATRPQKWHD